MTLAERVSAIEWYHSIDLGSGLVTPGWFDTRAAATKVPLPGDLSGKRCLDVGTWDGFWAFEMERRGASEVVAIDVLDPARWDWPAKARGGIGVEVLRAVKGASEGFELAREALGSRVERRDLSVYDLDPAEVGTFDVVFLGSLLLHLRDPVKALERVRGVTTGHAVIADSIELVPTLLWPRTPVARLEGGDRPWWWQPNRAALIRMVRSSGLHVEQATRPYVVPTGPGHPRPPWRTLPPRLRTAHGREEIVAALAGVPHVAVLAR